MDPANRLKADETLYYAPSIIPGFVVINGIFLVKESDVHAQGPEYVPGDSRIEPCKHHNQDLK